MGEAAKKEEEEKVVPVGPGAEGLAPEKDDDQDEREEDKRLAQSDDEPEEEQREADGRRKESARERRERLKKQRGRERLEYNFLLKRNEELEKRFMSIETRTAQTETAAIDQRLTSLKAQITNAQRVMVDAMKKPNGAGAEEFNEALEIRDQLRDQLSQLSSSKQARQQAQQAPRATAEEEPDPRIIKHAKSWAGEHDWYDFNGRDMDSLVVRAIDESLIGEGLKPTSPDYWDELTQRVKKALPHRFKNGASSRADEEDDMDEEEERPRAKAGPKFSSGGRERPLKKGEVYVSAERKRAMQEYGVWEDPVARNRMLKKYAQWDEETSSSKR